MRIDVKKFLFIGLEDDRLAFFKKAQEAGIIHFIESTAKQARDIPQEVTDITAAIKILRRQPVMEQEEIEEYALADGLTHKILHLKHTLDKLEEEQRVVRLEIGRVGIFGNFSMDDIAFIEKEGQSKVQFFFGKQGKTEEFPVPDEVVYIGTDHGMDYFVSINPQPMQYEKLVEMKIDHPVGLLRRRYQEIGGEIHATEQRLKAYQKYNTFLHHALVYALNTYHLDATEKEARPQIDNKLFSIEGWVPINKLDVMHALVEEMHVHVEEVAIEPTDIIPTYLENEGMHRIGEDVIRVYDTPSITDKDPSLWVLISFAFFFAFIVGDAGYGAIFLAFALYLHFKYTNLQGVKLRVLKLFTILGISVLAWGLLTNSIFGISLSPESPIRKVSLLNWLVEKKAAYHFERHDDVYDYWVKKYPNLKSAQTPTEFLRGAVTETDGKKSYDMVNKFSDNIMFELALLIGCVHVILSLTRNLGRNLIGLGWILLIVGGYMYFPSYLQATSITHFVFNLGRDQLARDGIYLMIVGIGLAVAISVFIHKLTGVLEVMTVIQVFADIMSYLRLYALGLAGAIMMGIINDGAAALPFIFGFILIVLGHLTNMTLAIMGGIIHGLRLNFLEWYHYSFEGGGKQFKPLYKMRVE